MSVTRRLSCGSGAAFLIVLCGCNCSDLTDSRNDIAGIYLGVGYSGYTSDVFLTLGDPDSLQAQAFSGGWPSHTIYDSSIEPRRFRWSSTNPAVATVDSVGHVTTLSIGETAMTASVAGVTSESIRVAVSPSAAAIVAEPTT